jgi:hypothetical protein
MSGSKARVPVPSRVSAGAAVPETAAAAAVEMDSTVAVLPPTLTFFLRGIESTNP